MPRDAPVTIQLRVKSEPVAELQAEGFAQVYRMSGGMMEWGQQQLPLVK